MPIYEYQCPKCTHRFEMIQGIESRESKVACPRCGHSKAEKVMSSFCSGGSKGSDSGMDSSCAPRPGRFS